MLDGTAAAMAAIATLISVLGGIWLKAQRDLVLQYQDLATNLRHDAEMLRDEVRRLEAQQAELDLRIRTLEKENTELRLTLIQKAGS